MRDADFPAFCSLLDDVAALLMPAQPLGGTAKAMYFRALGAASLDDVRAALDAHVKDPQRGRWFPKPADLVAQLDGLAADDGRPGADEAWSIGLLSDDEAASVVWTDEIAQAMAAAQPVLRAGDKVGARMAFREAYERIVSDARRARRPVRWSVTQGMDPLRVAHAVEQGVKAGRIARAELDALPAPAGTPLLALVGGTAADSDAAKNGRAAFMALRERMAEGGSDEHRPGADAAAKIATKRRQAEIAHQVRAAVGE